MENNKVSVKFIIDKFGQELRGQYRQEEILQFAYILFEEWMGWSRLDVHLNSQKLLKRGEVHSFLEALEQLKNNRPIQYITGVTHFLDLEIKVREGVLIPRPETEELVQLIMNDHHYRQYEQVSILDIGTGSGCIPIAIKKQFPGFDITAIDDSQVALDIAGTTALFNNCRINFLQADILDRNLWDSVSSFSLIVSNPPYVLESERSLMQRNVIDYEPHEALFVSDDDPHIYNKAIGEFAFFHLLRPGSLYLEINERFGRQIKDLLISTGFDKVEIIKDIHGKDRFIRAEAKTTFLDTSYWHVEH
ncbi:MAG: peptide chain release factor N(5)-glutamine methyltransferase [Bacteroidales bacterium]|jgi:release factor glutamine methyltransferase